MARARGPKHANQCRAPPCAPPVDRRVEGKAVHILAVSADEALELVLDLPYVAPVLSQKNPLRRYA